VARNLPHPLAGEDITMERNEKTASEEYYAQLAEHRSLGDANEANAEGTIYPEGEPIESTGEYATLPEPDDQG
jgi:hypothetical protein